MLSSFRNNFILNKQAWKFAHINDLQQPEFLRVSQILKVVSPLGKKLFSFSPLGLEIQKDYDSEISEFKLQSFRAFQRYLTDKNPTPSRETASITQFSAYRF